MKLVLENLVYNLSEFPLEVNIAFDAPIAGLCGPSGSGKTTLLELVAGLRRAQAGRIVLGGDVLADAARDVHLPPEQRRIGYVPQDLALFPHLNVKRNLLYGFRDGGLSLDRVVHILELDSLLGRRVQHISGGERQRVALGRALLAVPKLLLLDEPLAHLDPRLKDRILPYLRAIRDEFHIPIIYVSHAPSEIAALCDSVFVLDRGQGRMAAAAPPG